MRVLFWKWFRPEVYSAYVEVCKIKARLDKSKRLHYKYKHIEKEYRLARAIFEAIR